MRETKKNIEKGVTFLWVAVSFFVLAILLFLAVQPASIVAQRMKEKELLFRGREYTEGIRHYQYEHGGGFPTHLADLLKPGPKNYRYIRKLWRNPFDPDGKWGLLAPGATVVTIGEDGRPLYNSQPPPGSIQGPTGPPNPNQPQIPTNTGGTQTGSTGDESDKEGSGQQSGSGQPGSGPPGSGQPGGIKQVSKILPFRLDGQENQPIVGVWCKLHQKSFTEFFGANYYDEWFFSPLVLPPPPPVMVNPQAGPSPQQPQPQPKPPPRS